VLWYSTLDSQKKNPKKISSAELCGFYKLYNAIKTAEVTDPLRRFCRKQTQYSEPQLNYDIAISPPTPHIETSTFTKPTQQ
jgi:hypothetical protein